METMASVDPHISRKPFGFTYIFHKVVASDLCVFLKAPVSSISGQTALHCPMLVKTPPGPRHINQKYNQKIGVFRRTSVSMYWSAVLKQTDRQTY